MRIGIVGMADAPVMSKASAASSAVRQGKPSSHYIWLAVAALTIIAFVLRAIGIGGELWLDEILASMRSFRRSFVDLLTSFEGDNQHPLYSLLAHLGVVLFGETPTAIRLPAVIFGVASVPLLYALGARVASRREGLMAAALLTVSYHHVWFSQNARGYTMLAFWTMLSGYLLFRAISEHRIDKFVWYGIVVALAIYTHLTTVFMVAAHVLICAWLIMPWRKPRLDWRLPALGFAVGGVATLLLYAPLLDEVLNFFLNRPSRLLGVSTPAWALREGLQILRLGLGGGWPVLVGMVVLLAGLISYLRRSPLVFFIFVLPAMTTVAGALMGRGTMYPRFFFFLVGFALLIVVRGAVVISALVTRQSRYANALAGAVIALMVVASANSLRYNYANPKQAFQRAARHVELNRKPNEPVGVLNATWFAYIQYYQKPWHRLTYRDDPQDNPVANLMKLRGGSKVWLVYTFPRYIAHEAPGISQIINEECGDAAKFDSSVGDGDVYVCELAAMPIGTRP